MDAEGFTETTNNARTPNNMSVTEKPSKDDPTTTARVDINVLKARYDAHKLIYSHTSDD